MARITKKIKQVAENAIDRVSNLGSKTLRAMDKLYDTANDLTNDRLYQADLKFNDANRYFINALNGNPMHNESLQNLCIDYKQGATADGYLIPQYHIYYNVRNAKSTQKPIIFNSTGDYEQDMEILSQSIFPTTFLARLGIKTEQYKQQIERNKNIVKFLVNSGMSLENDGKTKTSRNNSFILTNRKHNLSRTNSSMAVDVVGSQAEPNVFMFNSGRTFRTAKTTFEDINKFCEANLNEVTTTPQIEQTPQQIIEPVQQNPQPAQPKQATPNQEHIKDNATYFSINFNKDTNTYAILSGGQEWLSCDEIQSTGDKQKDLELLSSSLKFGLYCVKESADMQQYANFADKQKVSNIVEYLVYSGSALSASYDSNAGCNIYDISARPTIQQITFDNTKPMFKNTVTQISQTDNNNFYLTYKNGHSSGFSMFEDGRKAYSMPDGKIAVVDENNPNNTTIYEQLEYIELFAEKALPGVRQMTRQSVEKAQTTENYTSIIPEQEISR